jgi:hypothetical protein
MSRDTSLFEFKLSLKIDSLFDIIIFFLRKNRFASQIYQHLINSTLNIV